MSDLKQTVNGLIAEYGYYTVLQELVKTQVPSDSYDIRIRDYVKQQGKHDSNVTRAFNALSYSGCRTMGQLMQIYILKGSYGFVGMRNVGIQSSLLIEAKLKEWGLVTA